MYSKDYKKGSHSATSRGNTAKMQNKIRFTKSYKARKSKESVNRVMVHTRRHYTV